MSMMVDANSFTIFLGMVVFGPHAILIFLALARERDVASAMEWILWEPKFRFQLVPGHITSRGPDSDLTPLTWYRRQVVVLTPRG